MEIADRLILGEIQQICRIAEEMRAKEMSGEGNSYVFYLLTAAYSAGVSAGIESVRNQ